MGMDRDAAIALSCDGDGQGNQFPRLGIERADLSARIAQP